MATCHLVLVTRYDEQVRLAVEVLTDTRGLVFEGEEFANVAAHALRELELPDLMGYVDELH